MLDFPLPNLTTQILAMTEDEIRERDKRLAAAHEAGHFVVCAYYGQFVQAKIERSESTDLSSERAWVGQVEIDDGDWTPAMAVAGEVAVALVEEPEYWNDLVGLVDDAMEEIRDDPNYLSPTDRAAFPNDEIRQRSAIIEALAILQNNRAFFEWASNELYNRGAIDFSLVGLACEFENNNDIAWQRAQRQLFAAELDQLATRLYAIWQTPAPDKDAAKAAEVEARRLTSLMARVERKILSIALPTGTL
jgi:hypothetical protein